LIKPPHLVEPSVYAIALRLEGRPLTTGRNYGREHAKVHIIGASVFLRARRNLLPLIKSVPRARHRAATPSAHLAASTCNKYALCSHGSDSFTNLLGLERTWPIRGEREEMTNGREEYPAYSRRAFGRSVATFSFDESFSSREIQRTSRFPKHVWDPQRASETGKQRSSSALPLVS